MLQTGVRRSYVPDLSSHNHALQRTPGNLVGLLNATRSVRVTGFGRRPYTDLDAGETGPAFESRQGRKARVWGSRISRRYGELYERGDSQAPFLGLSLSSIFGWRHGRSGRLHQG